MPIRTWEPLVERHFGFLRTEYGCVVADRSDKDWWATRIVYQNSTTAIQISRSIEFDRVEVELIRLVDGQRPPYPVFISEQPRLHYFLLDSLLKLRAPELLKPIDSHSGLRPRDVETQLSSWAAALREHGDDVLSGDHTVFETLEAELREFVRRNPEQVTIWSPRREGGRDEQSVAELRGLYPTVPVVLREYDASTPTMLERLGRMMRRMLGRG